jgi:hypothetical protein
MFFATTFALGSAAPVASVMTPRMPPVAVCARAVVEIDKISAAPARKIIAKALHFILREVNISILLNFGLAMVGKFLEIDQPESASFRLLTPKGRHQLR